MEALAVPQGRATIGGMSKDKKKPGRGGPATGRSPFVAVFARVPPPLAQALEGYRNTLRPKPTATAVVVAALEDFLQAKGFWPPPDLSQLAGPG
jgi:hypothetical protein